MSGLRTRPSAETFPLDDLVALALEGRLRVPAFQRGLRWDRRDVVLLFDSVLKGFPVGSLLLWERSAPEEQVVLGPLHIDAPAGTAYYVVDGQQRITALAAALTESGATHPRFAVGYDLEADAFTGRPGHPSETWVPAHVLFDGTALLTWFRDHPGLMEHFDVAAAAAKTLRDLRLPAYVVKQDDEEVLRSIFDRMNNAGKKLNRGEVFEALHGSTATAGEASPRSLADEVQARTGFGTFDERLVAQILLARRGADVSREIRNEFEPKAKGRDAFAASEGPGAAYRGGADAAVAAITFLEQVAGVPHQTFLPNQYLLVMLARFFSHHPHPSPRHQRLLRRFFWRAAVIGPNLVPGSTTGVSRMANRKVLPDDEVASIEGLMSMVARDAPPYPPVDPFKANTAASRVLLCAMWDVGPKNLHDGGDIEPEALRRVLGDEPTAADVVVPLLQRRRDVDRERGAGNRLLLVSEEDRESDVIEAMRAATPDVLGSHVVEPADLDELRGPVPRTVVERRSRRLEAVQRVFLDRMCEWEQDDSPDLAMLVAAAETVDAVR